MRLIGLRPIHLDVAINGYLAKEHDIANLLIGHSGWSPALDQAFQKTGYIGSVSELPRIIRRIRRGFRFSGCSICEQLIL
jgi:hypothetical protein